MDTAVTAPGAGMAPLDFTAEVRRATAPIYERLRHVIPEHEWPVHAPYLAAIRRLKLERKAVILAHYYQMPEIFHGVADLTGDSLALAREAAATHADRIVVCGVRFMAETAKLLNPEKIVLIPDPAAGCSLADSITAEDVRLLRERHPGVPVVAYVNTSAAVKAEADLCCTSANAVQVVESLGTSRVIFLPDEYLGRYVAAKSAVQVILWRGHCEVHEQFSLRELRSYRQQFPGIEILAHPECPPEVIEEADFVGSTSGMIRHVGAVHPRCAVMITECSMSDNAAVEFPDIRFVRPSIACPHMKLITLPKILETLLTDEYSVEVPSEVAGRARLAVQRMIDLAQKGR
jgi:quinolinate synthase